MPKKKFVNMALLPFMFDDDLLRSHRFSHQWSEPDLHDWPALLPNRSFDHHLRDLRSPLAHYDPGTFITVDKDHFQATIDIQQFTPEEISVKLVDDHTVKVEAKHEEQQDDHGFISRHFVRRYLLPNDCDATKLQSKLSSDGVLLISAPKKRGDDEIDGQGIPIMHTGRPIIRRPHLWPSHRDDKRRKSSASN